MASAPPVVLRSRGRRAGGSRIVRKKPPKTLGKYRIESVLGEGGAGVVYLAFGPDGAEVALKVLHDELAGDTVQRKRFAREMRLAVQVVHPNIVRTFEAGQEDGKLFMACEVVRGGSVQDLLKREKRLDEARALALARDLVAALDALHRSRIVHRDVKPANLLLDESGTAKLTDLGLAREEFGPSSVTRPGQIVGTPACLSPEQIRGKDVDIRCDLYATGAVLHHCLAGVPPFDVKTVVEMLRAHLEFPVPDLRHARPDVRAEVALLVKDLLQKDREQRPATPAAVLDRIDALLGRSAPFDPLADTKTPEYAKVSSPPASKDEPGETFLPLWPRVPLAVIAAAHVERPKSAAAALAGRKRTKSAIGEGMSRAALVVETPSEGPKTLFVYSGRRLLMGRHGLEHPGQDVCLRLRPVVGNEVGIRAISGQHLSVIVDEHGAAQVQDEGSTCGTTLDDEPLEPRVPRALGERNTVDVARFLELSLAVVWPGGPPGETTAPSVLIRRPVNGKEHAYALVPERIVLGARGAGRAEIFWSGQSLRVKGGRGGAHDEGRPLVPGLSFKVAGLSVEVREIRPQDQK